MGWIYIGYEQITLHAETHTVEIGNGLGKSAMAMPDTPMVNVNVFSARWTDEDNLLNCGIVDGPVAHYIGTTQVITCKLIGG
jgi:hypothetical protein